MYLLNIFLAVLHWRIGEAVLNQGNKAADQPGDFGIRRVGIDPYVKKIDFPTESFPIDITSFYSIL